MKESGVNIKDAMIITHQLVGEVCRMDLDEGEQSKVEVAAKLFNTGAVCVILDWREPVSGLASENISLRVKPNGDNEQQKYIEVLVNSDASYLMTSGDDREAYLKRMKGVMIEIAETHEKLNAEGKFISFKDWIWPGKK